MQDPQQTNFPLEMEMDLFVFHLSEEKFVPQYVKFTVNISFLLYIASFHYHLLSTRVLSTKKIQIIALYLWPRVNCPNN